MLQAMENVESALREIPLDESGLAPIELPPEAIIDAVTLYQQSAGPPETRDADTQQSPSSKERAGSAGSRSHEAQ